MNSVLSVLLHRHVVLIGSPLLRALYNLFVLWCQCVYLVVPCAGVVEMVLRKRRRCVSVIVLAVACS